MDAHDPKTFPKRYRAIAPRPPEGPIDLSLLLPSDAGVELDIGFGRGRSLFTRAARDPNARILGVEIKTKWSTVVAKRVAREELDDRVVVWCADIRALLPRLTPDGGLARVFVHFPDPWWKKRHDKRRVISEDLLDQLARLIRPDGDLYVQTDVPHRAAQYAGFIAEHSAFSDPQEIEENPFGGVSNREARAAVDGLPVHRLIAKRLA